MALLTQLFAKSPFGPLVEHSKKVKSCVERVRPLIEALIEGDYDAITRLQHDISQMEHEADLIKTEIRASLPKRMFLPVDRDDMNRYLKQQDNMADAAEELAILLTLRRTVVHPQIQQPLREFVGRIVDTADTLFKAAFELADLAEASFGGAEADRISATIDSLDPMDWKADKMKREILRQIYSLEDQLDPVTISFYEKILEELRRIAKHAENTGDALHLMIVKR